METPETETTNEPGQSNIAFLLKEYEELWAQARHVDDLHNLLKEGSLAERRTFIKSFIKEIRVTGNEAVLAYTIPILPEKVTIEKEGVLPIVQYGGRYWT